MYPAKGPAGSTICDPVLLPWLKSGAGPIDEPILQVIQFCHVRGFQPRFVRPRPAG